MTSPTQNKLSNALLAAGLVAAATLASQAAYAEVDLGAVPSGTYTVDPTHAYINFQYVHLGLSEPTLSFDDFTIDLNLDTADATKSSVAVEIDAASVLTGSEIWYDHITGGKWFDTANNPTMTFTSTAIEGSGDSYTMTGDLTIKGTTKPVTLDVKINGAMMHPMQNKPVIGISATGALKRSDWGLGANAPFISDDVTLNITAEMFKS